MHKVTTTSEFVSTFVVEEYRGLNRKSAVVSKKAHTEGEVLAAVQVKRNRFKEQSNSGTKTFASTVKSRDALSDNLACLKEKNGIGCVSDKFVH